MCIRDRVKGENVMLGYWNNQKETEKVLIDGWLHTGDIGVFEKNFLKITDRKKDILITPGGDNISPIKIENDLLNFKSGENIGFIVKSGCDFISPISHPSNLIIGIGVSAIGTSSVTYKSAVFKENDEFASAQGFFTHVYVNRTTQKASPISKEFREKLNEIFKP